MPNSTQPIPYSYTPDEDAPILNEARRLNDTMKKLYPRTSFGINSALEVVFKLSSWLEKNNIFVALESGKEAPWRKSNVS